MLNCIFTHLGDEGCRTYVINCSRNRYKTVTIMQTPGCTNNTALIASA